MKSGYVLMAELFKALGDENRLKLLEELKEGEKNAGELLEKLSVTQPTLSHHMKILCDSGIVDSRKDGKWTYYKISEERVGGLLDIIGSFTKGRKKYTFRMEDVVIPEIKEEPAEKAEEKKSEKKKSAKKPAKKEKVNEVPTPSVEEVKEAEVIKPATDVEKPEEPVKEEPKKEESGNYTMPSWLF